MDNPPCYAGMGVKTQGQFGPRFVTYQKILAASFQMAGLHAGLRKYRIASAAKFALRARSTLLRLPLWALLPPLVRAQHIGPPGIVTQTGNRPNADLDRLANTL